MQQAAGVKVQPSKCGACHPCPVPRGIGEKFGGPNFCDPKESNCATSAPDLCKESLIFTEFSEDIWILELKILLNYILLNILFSIWRYLKYFSSILWLQSTTIRTVSGSTILRKTMTMSVRVASHKVENTIVEFDWSCGRILQSKAEKIMTPLFSANICSCTSRTSTISQRASTNLNAAEWNLIPHKSCCFVSGKAAWHRLKSCGRFLGSTALTSREWSMWCEFSVAAASMLRLDLMCDILSLRMWKKSSHPASFRRWSFRSLSWERWDSSDAENRK